MIITNIRLVLQYLAIVRKLLRNVISLHLRYKFFYNTEKPDGKYLKES